MNLIPTFNKHQILKAEMLEALRDNPVNFINTIYAEYFNGIIEGFSVTIDRENNMFIISPGIVKFNNEVYIVQTPLDISIKNGQHYVYLCIEHKQNENGRLVAFSLLDESKKQDSKIELFRYYKSETSGVKQPRNFNDACVEASNTINYSHSVKAVKKGKTLRSEIFELYAQELLAKNLASYKDIVFGYKCLEGISTFSILSVYFQLQEKCTNKELLELMNNRLKNIKDDNINIPEEAPITKGNVVMEID